MDIVVACCAGLDVPKKTVVACRRCLQSDGHVHKEVRTFGTMTADLLALSKNAGNRPGFSRARRLLHTPQSRWLKPLCSAIGERAAALPDGWQTVGWSPQI